MTATPPLSSATRALEQLLAGFAEGHIAFGTLMRGLTLYPGWRTLSDGAGGVLTRETPEGTWLDLFLTESRAQQRLAQVAQDRALRDVAISGDVLANLDEGLAGVHVHPGQDLEVVIERRDEARLWAQSALVEAMLVQGRPLDLGMLREWRGWVVLLRQDANGQRQLTLTTDADGRPLAAVFTAEDCCDAFVARVPEGMRGDLVRQRMMGAQLFSQLVYLPVHGAAFNPAGPVPGRAYDKGWLEDVVRFAAVVN